MKEVEKIRTSLSGTGPAFSMLAYLSTQLLILTGVTSLERYRGVGSEDYTSQTPFNKIQLKEYINDYINEPDKENTYAAGKLINDMT